MSMAVFDYVENNEYRQANLLAGGMLAVSFAVLIILYMVNGRLNRSHQT